MPSGGTALLEAEAFPLKVGAGAHIFIAFLAYCLLVTLKQRLKTLVARV
jgi:hypothetical protein